jgi:hypothetical protein
MEYIKISDRSSEFLCSDNLDEDGEIEILFEPEYRGALYLNKFEARLLAMQLNKLFFLGE